MSKFTALLTAIFFSASLGGAYGGLVTYIDADPASNTAAADGSASWYAYYNSPTDNLWCYSSGGGPMYVNGTVFETRPDSATFEEDVPLIVTTISGLAAGSSYEVYGYFDCESSWLNWDIMFGLSGDSMVDYGGDPGVPGREYGTSLFGIDPTTRFTNLSMMPQGNWSGSWCEVLIGVATADGNGEIDVYVDSSTVGTGANARTYYDGVGYALVPEPGALALLAAGMIGLLCYAWRRRK